MTKKMTAAIAALLMTPAAHGQLFVPQSLHAMDNDKEKGRKCYNGTCDGCTEDCSKKTTTTACYLCVAGQCDGNVQLEAQKFCDGEYQSPVAPDLVTELAEGLFEDEPRVLTVADVRVLDRAIVGEDVATSKLAAAALLEADAMGLVAPEAEHMVGEIHVYLLMYGGDMPAAQTARKVFDDFGLSGQVDLSADLLARLRHNAIATGDARLLVDVLRH